MSLVDPVDYPVQTCSQCGSRNRIRPHSLLTMKPICANCGGELEDPYWLSSEVKESVNSREEDSNATLESCPDCGQLNRIQPHSLSYKPVCARCGADLNDPFRDAEDQWLARDGMIVERVAFRLLPPGSWSIDDVIAHYRHEATNLPSNLIRKDLQWRRLLDVKSLGAHRCWIGEHMWMGYCVFMFPFSSKAVLECPFEGNATYILSESWKQLAMHTKQDLRRLFPNRHRKVVHKGDWLARVRSSL